MVRGAVADERMQRSYALVTSTFGYQRGERLLAALFGAGVLRPAASRGQRHRTIRRALRRRQRQPGEQASKSKATLDFLDEYNVRVVLHDHDQEGIRKNRMLLPRGVTVPVSLEIAQLRAEASAASRAVQQQGDSRAGVRMLRRLLAHCAGFVRFAAFAGARALLR